MGVGKDKIVNNQFSDSSVHGNTGVRLGTISDVNPFLENFNIECTRRDGGYVKIGSNYQRNFFLSEREDKTSLYCSKSRRDRISVLGASGMRLFIWIVYTVKRGEDKYWLNTKQFMRETGVSLNTMKSGIKELVDGGIIAPTKVKNAYFLDPSLFYKGNRVLDYANHVVVTDSSVAVDKSVYGRIGLETNDEFEKEIDDIF